MSGPKLISRKLEPPALASRCGRLGQSRKRGIISAARRAQMCCRPRRSRRLSSVPAGLPPRPCAIDRGAYATWRNSCPLLLAVKRAVYAHGDRLVVGIASASARVSASGINQLKGKQQIRLIEFFDGVGAV